MTTSWQNELSKGSLARAIPEETRNACVGHSTAAASSQDDECELAYQAAIERLMALASAGHTEKSAAPEAGATAITAPKQGPASHGGRVGTERVAEAPMGQASRAVLEDDKSIPEKRPAESREQLLALRTLANAAAANSVNAHLRKRRRTANALLLTSTFVFGAMVVFIRSPLVHGPQGACCGLVVLVFSSLLVISSLLKVRRLGSTELPEYDVGQSNEVELPIREAPVDEHRDHPRLCETSPTAMESRQTQAEAVGPT